MSQSFERLLGGIAASIVETSSARPWLVVGLCALATAGSIAIAATVLEVDTDSDRILRPDLPARKTNLALEAAFPELQHNLVVMIEADDPDDAREAAEALSAKLRAEPERYPGIFLPGESDFYDDFGLFYLDDEELHDLATRIEKSGQLLATLGNRPELPILLGALTHTIGSVDGLAGLGEDGPRILDHVSLAVERFNAGSHAPIPWDDLLFEDRFAGPDRVWIVCGADHARGVRSASGLPPGRVLVEPQRRNTAMAVGLAAERIVAEDPEATFAVLPADHRIPDERAFAAAMRRAAAAARGAEVLVTLGVRPSRPDIGYGYIHVGPAAGSGYAGLHRVRRFVEKPDLPRARRYVRNGGFLWNAGIFVWNARTILEELERHAPGVYDALDPVRRAGRRLTARTLEKAYAQAPSEPIDTAVMEKSQRVWTLPVDFHWSDVGTWESLAAELGVEPGSSRVLGGDVVFDDPGGNLVWGAEGRVIALLGVEGVAVIDTPDALLVTSLSSSPDAKRIVARLKAKGLEDVT